MKQSLQDSLNIKYPIFQAPMAGGIVSPDFVAEVCDFGILGGIASGYLSLTQTREVVKEVKEKTNKPFSLNIFVDYAIYGETPLEKPKEVIALERNLDLNSTIPGYMSTFYIPSNPQMDDLIQLAIDEEIPIVSTVFGLLSTKHVDALKANNIKILTTVNSIYEIEMALEFQSSDVLIYQSSKAGGHKGGFTSLPHDDNHSILQHLKSHSNIPCVLAGGIVTRQDVNNAINMGFDGVQIGTAFLATQESSANDAYKKAILVHEETAFTTSITGKAARGLKNDLACLEIDNNLGFPYMHYATAGLRKAAKAVDHMDYQSLWCGDGISRITSLPTLQVYMGKLVQ